MPQTATKPKLDDTTEPPMAAPRTLPVIDPETACVNYAGAANKEVFVRLPKEAIADDLKERSIWKRIQANKTLALRKLDRVVMVSHDEANMWIAYVSESGPSWANISRPTRHELKSRHANYYFDDTYRVEWSGSAYIIIRLADSHTMPGSFATEKAAIKALNELYPKPLDHG